MLKRHPLVNLALLAATSLVACDAVTDPLAGQPDPRSVLGAWYTVSFSGEPALYEARIEGGGAPFHGEFRFPLHGRTWFVQFRDAEWNGRALSFTTKTDFGFTLADSTIHWAATLVPESGTADRADWRPTRLSLAAHTVDGLAFTWDYFRRDDLIRLHPELENAPVR
ncbi:MAG: hypothetical protein KY397_04000 [Gemmatimonadetes bacterium]|nr:hypothetical protein [Gemmatimonadota bacterium]